MDPARLEELAERAEALSERLGGPWGPTEHEAIRKLFAMVATRARALTQGEK